MVIRNYYKLADSLLYSEYVTIIHLQEVILDVIRLITKLLQDITGKVLSAYLI